MTRIIKINEDKEPVFPYDTSSAEMEEDIIEKKYEIKKVYDGGKEDECPNKTPPTEIQECGGDRNANNNGDNDEEKEAKCLVKNSPDVMEEDGSDKKIKRMKTIMREKN